MSRQLHLLFLFSRPITHVIPAYRDADCLSPLCVRHPPASQELAEEVQKVVEPLRDQLDAVVVFPSMPEVMRLNKVGSFTMQNLGQSKSVVSDFMKKKKKVRSRVSHRR